MLLVGEEMRTANLNKDKTAKRGKRNLTVTSFGFYFGGVARNDNDSLLSNGRSPFSLLALVPIRHPFCITVTTVRMIHIVMSVDDISIVAESHRSTEQKDRFGNTRLSVSRRNHSRSR
ncbi:unnamed protein product [Brugia timori]|uniref:Uncharacterized protein n=1 Tax=Brugia timori TaxID=42155 RepID=A0A3P7X3G0_9BILA|nr:unnamed protein product [Brugia timori]